MGGKWILRNTNVNTALMAETLGIDETFAKVLAHRGVNSRKTAVGFISPSLKDCADFSMAADSEKACDIVLAAIGRGDNIRVYGDYDVDGVMSTVILVKAIRALGGAADYTLPHREKDGYGLNEIRAREIAEGGAKLLITCDNGITAHKEIELLRDMGVAAVVIDHHEPLLSGIPAADAVVDPKRFDCPYPYKKMCAAALCLRFCAQLHKAAGARYDGFHEALGLAAIATFCDIVDLTGENRAIAKAGLDILSENPRNLGLAALFEERGVSNRKFSAFDAGFVIGPCVNACGRLESAELAVKLFLTDDGQEAKELAMRMAALNEERKTATEQGAAAALAIAASKEYSQDKVLCVYAREIGEAVAGIVAGRVKEKLGKPTIILTDAKLPDGSPVLKGSCRSIDGFDIFKALYDNRELFIRFGGHPMAAGLTMAGENLDALRHSINNNCKLTDDDFSRSIYIDDRVPLEFANLQNAERLNRFEPFGKGAEAPVFASRAEVVYAELIGAAKTTLRASLKSEGGFYAQAIMFNGADYIAVCKGEVEAAYCLEVNEFRGERAARVRLVDIAAVENNKVGGDE